MELLDRIVVCFLIFLNLCYRNDKDKHIFTTCLLFATVSGFQRILWLQRKYTMKKYMSPTFLKKVTIWLLFLKWYSLLGKLFSLQWNR